LSVAPPQILTAEELECLEPLLQSGLSLAQLLAKKTADPHWRGRSMKDYLMLHEGQELRDGPYLTNLHSRAFAAIQEHINLHVEYGEQRPDRT
jgi:hypothetical protein